ncbi:MULTISPECIES: hypothetical protein [unclassified Streptomyces]|uniref:hypothetical protein n=1 Tax=unclassified Streptomyces TaxID=2593676 RepID=UPI00099B484D|nr:MULTISPECIES: hypothetical protein [unclassified Streptomyces]MBD3548847.1 hypothetical protein [Streptomyces sp. JV180]
MGFPDRARSGPPDRASCVPGAFARIGPRGDGAGRYRSGSGDICADEGNHWDVTHYNCGGC